MTGYCEWNEICIVAELMTCFCKRKTFHLGNYTLWVQIQKLKAKIKKWFIRSFRNVFITISILYDWNFRPDYNKSLLLATKKYHVFKYADKPVLQFQCQVPFFDSQKLFDCRAFEFKPWAWQWIYNYNVWSPWLINAFDFCIQAFALGTGNS